MLHGYLGAEDFRDGLRAYLSEHAYKNTVTNDLWSALEKSSGKPVKSFMHAWTSLPGFPLLKVDNKQLHQERFYMVKPEKARQDTWPIPLLGGPEAAERLDTHHADHSVHMQKLNSGQSGFYRTLYTPEVLAALTDSVAEFEPLDRLGLLADSFETAKAGYGSAVESVKLLEKYTGEDNAAVWDIIAGNIGELRRVMDSDELREAIKPLIVKLTARQLERLGVDEKPADSHFDKLLRPTILGMAAGADEPTTLRWCLDTFAQAKKTEDIHPDLRGVVFTTAARHGDKKVFDKLLAFHDSTDLSEERTTIAAALTAFEDLALIDRALSLIDTATVRRQDAMYWVAYSFMNRHAKRATWEWMKDKWPWLDKELGSDLSFYRTPVYAARSFSEESFRKEYDEFFATHSQPVLERSIKQGAEMLDWQISWKQRDLTGLLDLLG